jgi:transposase
VYNDVVYDVSYFGGGMRGEILGVERRRRWSDEEKLSIVLTVGVDGATITQVAQRHEVTRQQIYTWRHALKHKGLWPVEGGALFLPLDVAVVSETKRLAEWWAGYLESGGAVLSF